MSESDNKNNKSNKKSSLLAALGPGIIWASTSIGVSHVVQSTRAGAEFGFTLIGLIIMANIIKYPFFQIGPRYAAATGESLLDGYKRLGNVAFGSFLIMTVATMFIIQAAVTIVAAGLAGNLIPNLLSVSGWAAVVLFSIIAILVIGRYALLDKVLKGMMVVFALVTVLALIMTLTTDTASFTQDTSQLSFTSAASIAFMVALIGWMPTSIEVSVWHSLWTLSRMKQTDQKLTVKDALFDFNLGFVFCLVLALIFLTLGATLVYGTGEVLSGGAIGFTGQLIDIFVKSLGDWTWPIIALITFIAMYSTCLAVSAGFSDVGSRVVKIIKTENDSSEQGQKDADQLAHKVYTITLVSIAIGGWLIINYFGSSLRQLIDFATTVSFVSAPVFAFLNLRVMSLSNVPAPEKLSASMNTYSWVCFYVLTGFSLYFVYWRFFS
ncbi:MAG: hypothetical protein KUG78_21010 [Kangiellaceae bacterium]|nr:hypothetical protein [Kangiellaceae bacterium]